VVIAVWLGLYRPDAARARPQLILAAMTVVSIIIAAAFFVAAVDVGSLIALLMFFVVAVLLDCVLRYLYDVVSRRWVLAHCLQPRILMLGRPAEVRPLAKNMTSPGGRPLQTVAFLAPAPNQDKFCVGTYDDLESRLHELHISELVIADRKLSTAEKADLIRKAQSFGVDVRFVASDEEIIVGAVGRVGDQGLVYVPAALMEPEALELKRLMDRIIVTATLPVWGTVLAFYAIYSRIRRPGQDILVTANRIGLGQTGFSMLRLRTRRIHDDDTRGVYPTGRVEALFERTGLDELPQVVNVLRDEMSTVGPRPLAAADVAALSVDQRRTLGARPGMTGRWQVSWPHAASEPVMRTLDADYLRRWRISHDLELILRTPIAIWRRRTALSDTELSRRRDDPRLGIDYAT
jgi:lipopolysaccharide/colanic/teichoic acid biosynthesis glycosyltransferase